MESLNLVYERFIDNIAYKYYIVKSIKKFEDFNDEVEIFGIKIDKLYGDSVLESRKINAVGINKQDVTMFLQTLWNRNIEPKDLKNIKEEYVSKVV